MPKGPRDSILQVLGGWCGVLCGGAMVLVLAYLGTALFQSNAGIEWGKRLVYIPVHRTEYRFCWAAMIVISTGLLPFIFSLYKGLKDESGTLALLGSTSGILAILFTDIVGAIRASAIPSIAGHMYGLTGPADLKNSLGLTFLLTEKFAFNVDNYVVTGFFALAGIFFGTALGSVARYPRTIVYGLFLVALLGIAAIGEDLMVHTRALHIGGYDYNVFVVTYTVLLAILVTVMGVRLVSGKNP